jgi:hypothetical protein
MTVVAMKEMLSSGVTMISSLTIDSAYNMIAGADPNYSFTAELESMIAMLPDVLSAELVFNANGAFVKALAFAGEDKVEITVVNGEYHFICIRAGMEVQLTVGVETGFTFSAYRGQELVANVALSNNNGAIGGNVEIDGNDFLDLTIDATNGGIESANVVIRTLEGGYHQEHYNEFTGEWEYVYVPQELVEQTEINYVATVVDGVTTQANATIKGWDGEYDEETYEYVETYGVVATISYTNNDGNIDAHLYVEDEARVDLSNEMTDSSNIFTMEIWDLQAGENGDETEQVGEAIFGYQTIDAGTKLFANVMNLDGDEEELLLDAEVIVDDNGNIVSVDYMVDSSNYSGYGHSNEYQVGEDLYRDCEDVYPGEVVTLSYVTTENGGAWSMLTTYTETTYTYTERYDVNLDEWVLVGTKNVETETTTSGANISYALTDNGAIITIGYDLGESEAVGGKGGVSLTIS